MVTTNWDANFIIFYESLYYKCPRLLLEMLLFVHSVLECEIFAFSSQVWSFSVHYVLVVVWGGLKGERVWPFRS